MRIFLIGVPIPVGGAGTEAFHSCLLWRKRGIEVTCLYFTQCPCDAPMIVPCDNNPFVSRLEAVGVDFVPCETGRLAEVPGLAGSLLVSFRTSHSIYNWPEFAALGCRMVYLPTMNFLSPPESHIFSDCPPTALVCESKFQESLIGRDMRTYGCGIQRVIHGAFDETEFPFRPRERGEAFVVGRLARVCRTKWSPHLWPILSDVRERGVDIRALCMGWDETLTRHCGEPPEWAECLLLGTIPAGEFIGRCHTMIAPNWGMPENWPRLGLECMAAGVPLVVDSIGGWLEQTGDAAWHCGSPKEFSDALEELAKDEGHRQSLIEAGRERLREIANPEVIGGQWEELFNLV